MMVPHSTANGAGGGDGPRPLSDRTALVLREAVRRVAGKSPSAGAAAPAAPTAPASDHGGDRVLRDAVAAAVAEARERQMRPEELLAAFKALLDAIPEVQGGVSGRIEEARLRERLVTLCIKAYYER
jgi:hypothetical protein